jgi:hypothetical protein
MPIPPDASGSNTSYEPTLSGNGSSADADERRAGDGSAVIKAGGDPLEDLAVFDHARSTQHSQCQLQVGDVVTGRRASYM